MIFCTITEWRGKLCQNLVFCSCVVFSGTVWSRSFVSLYPLVFIVLALCRTIGSDISRKIVRTLGIVCIGEQDDSYSALGIL